ncbi:MAG TPA: sulfite exporter TauE/SafE family protein [Gaiellales bacterium]|nr:sulfite exporter TauE/SafE family protein [Gaiellales bacterium]
MSHVALALALGLAGGVLAGLFGVGGGIVFVPALTLGLGLGQLTAEATSLAAIVPVVAVGSFRQHRDGLVHWPSAGLLGACSLVGVLIGAEIALDLPESALRRAFAAFLLLSALQMALRARRQLQAAAP